MKAIYDVPAPAKLNAFLHITGRRADGYHLIESVFMLIDWCDTLHFELRLDGQINRHDLNQTDTPTLPTEDLTVRAAKALQAVSGTAFGADISLEKRIPTQAGMGGGSSDAASCLLALQRLWGLNLPREKLISIALSLGADVPFFLCGSSAWVEGVGELITPIELPLADFVVIKPRAGLSTHAIFSSPDLKRNTAAATIEGFAKISKDQVFRFGRNDLEATAQVICPDITHALSWLRSAGLTGRMTGSGSAVFAHSLQKQDLHRAPSEWDIRRCSNLASHPLAGW